MDNKTKSSDIIKDFTENNNNNNTLITENNDDNNKDIRHENVQVEEEEEEEELEETTTSPLSQEEPPLGIISDPQNTTQQVSELPIIPSNLNTVAASKFVSDVVVP